MTDSSTPVGAGWFAGLEPGDIETASDAITEGEAEEPQDWPKLAVEAGFVDSEAEYYNRLHEVSVQTTRAVVRETELADDQQLKQSIRAMDDCTRTANELAERLSEWAGSYYEETGGGVDYAREVAGREASDSTAARIVALARRVTDLADEGDELRSFVERRASTVAPNLSAIAGPVLAARLIALAGGLESLAKKPSGTLQVLGAEDALFAHLRGHAPSPKHGIIYTHEYVRGTRSEDRGSAARALAGKLSIAARIDHYSGQRKPEIDEELADRIERIRARGDG